MRTDVNDVFFLGNSCSVNVVDVRFEGLTMGHEPHPERAQACNFKCKYFT